MDFHIFIYIAVLLFVALLSTRLMKIFKLPNVTGYIVTGIVIGPFVFGLLFNNFTYDGIKDSAIYLYIDIRVHDHERRGAADPRLLHRGGRRAGRG